MCNYQLKKFPCSKIGRFRTFAKKKAEQPQQNFLFISPTSIDSTASASNLYYVNETVVSAVSFENVKFTYLDQ